MCLDFSVPKIFFCAPYVSYKVNVEYKNLLDILIINRLKTCDTNDEFIHD